MTLTFTCSHCRTSLTVASGYVAEAMPRIRQFELLREVGWKCAPRMLCDKCNTDALPILYFNPESDCIFWSDFPIDDSLVSEIGRSRRKTRTQAMMLFRDAHKEKFSYQYFNEAFKQ